MWLSFYVMWINIGIKDDLFISLNGLFCCFYILVLPCNGRCILSMFYFYSSLILIIYLRLLIFHNQGYLPK